MREHCAVLYDQSVRQEIKKLRWINEAGLQKLADHING